MTMCLTCKQEKPLNDMSVQRAGPSKICKPCKNKKQKEYYEKQKFCFPFKTFLQNLKGRCDKADIPMNLTTEHLQNIWSGMCPVFGFELQWEYDQSKDNTAELDRQFPDKGYVIGNVSWISRRANRLKQDSSREDLLKILEYIDSAPIIYNKNPSEIILDGVSLQERRGKHIKKARNPSSNARLTEEQVIEILTMLSKGEKQKDIALKFNTSIKNIWKIKSGKSWKHLQTQEKQ